MDSLREGKRRVKPWESVETLDTNYHPWNGTLAGPLFQEPDTIYEADSTWDQTASQAVTVSLPENQRPPLFSSRFEHPKTHEQDGSHSTNPVHAVFNGANPHNITVHLNIPVIDDLESELEEFSILRRLGNFKAAKAYFKERLGEYRRVPYVFVQYAQMLLDAGDFKALSKLRPEVVFRPAGEYVRTPGMTGYDTSLSHNGQNSFEELLMCLFQAELLTTKHWTSSVVSGS